MNKSIPMIVAALLLVALLFAGCTQPATPAGNNETTTSGGETVIPGGGAQTSDLGVAVDDLGVSQGTDEQMDTTESVPIEPAA